METIQNNREATPSIVSEQMAIAGIQAIDYCKRQGVSAEEIEVTINKAYEVLIKYNRKDDKE